MGAFRPKKGGAHQNGCPQFGIVVGAVKKHISSSEEAEITVRSMVFFASLCWRRCKWTACFCPIHTAFLEGGAKRPACQWQERPLGRRELSESTETSGGRGSDPPRRLRLRKGEPFFGLQRTVPPQILSFRFFTAPVLCASLGLHLPSSAAGGGRFRPPSEKAEWKEEGEKKPACFSDGNGTEEQAGSLFWEGKERLFIAL